MTCQDYRDRLSDYLDGTLPAESAEGVRAHLAGCPACRDTCRSLESTQALLARLPARRLGPDFADVVRRAVERDVLVAEDEPETLPAAPARVSARPPARGRWVLAAAVLLAAGIGVLAWPRDTGVGPSADAGGPPTHGEPAGDALAFGAWSGTVEEPIDLFVAEPFSITDPATASATPKTHLFQVDSDMSRLDGALFDERAAALAAEPPREEIAIELEPTPALGRTPAARFVSYLRPSAAIPAPRKAMAAASPPPAAKAPSASPAPAGSYWLRRTDREDVIVVIAGKAAVATLGPRPDGTGPVDVGIAPEGRVLALRAEPDRASNRKEAGIDWRTGSIRHAAPLPADQVLMVIHVEPETGEAAAREAAAGR